MIATSRAVGKRMRQALTGGRVRALVLVALLGVNFAVYAMTH